MGTNLILGLMLVGATFATLLRAVKLRRLLGFSVIFDLVFSAVALASFAGSFAGLIVATFAGLVMAVSLTVLRLFVGYDRPGIAKTRRGLIRRKLVWVHRPPKYRLWGRTA